MHVSDGSVAEVGRTNRDRVSVVRLEKRGLQTARNRPRRARSSVEGTCVGRRHRPRGGSSNANRFGSMGPWESLLTPSCLAGSNPHTKLDLHPFPKAMKPRHDRRRFGVQSHVLLTGFVVEPPGGLGQCEGTHESQDEGVCAQRSRGRIWSRENVPRLRHETSEIGVDSSKARPAHHPARGGSASERAS